MTKSVIFLYSYILIWYILFDLVAAIYDVQLGFPETPIKPTFSNMLRGHSFSGDIHIRRIPMEEVPTDSEEATGKWLHKLYQEKVSIALSYIIICSSYELYIFQYILE